MPQFLNQPPDGNPTAAEVFRVFRTTMMASIEGLRLLLEECAHLRAELVTIHGLYSDRDDHGVFSSRQQDRIVALQEAEKGMEALIASLPQGASDGEDLVVIPQTPLRWLGLIQDRPSEWQVECGSPRWLRVHSLLPAAYARKCTSISCTRSKVASN